MDMSMWEDLESHRRPLGVSEAERQRVVEGQQPAPLAGTVGSASPTENGSVGHPSPSTATDPAPLSATDDQRLREAVMHLRFSQPDEFDVFSRMAQIEKQLADVRAIVDLQTEVILRLSKKAAA
jgi:hypothetical protein